MGGKDGELKDMGMHAAGDAEKLDKNYRPVERFYHDIWAPFIFKTRWFVIVFFILLIGVSVYGATLLGPQEAQEEWFPETHPYRRAVENLNEFGASTEDRLVEVSIVWGLKGMRTGNTDPYDPLDRGTVIFDEMEQLNDIEAVRDNAVANCFMRDFRLYRQMQGLAFPAPRGEFLASFAGFVRNSPWSPLYTQYIALTAGDDPEILFVSVAIDADVKPFAGQAATRNIYDKFEAFTTRMNVKATEDGVDGCNNAYQTAFYNWTWMNTAASFVENAVIGLAVSLALAFVVLVLSTMNIIVGFFAVFCIGGIVVSTIAFMVIAGWQLGVTESIAVVLLVGFSVDYVVHLANSYVESKSETRYDMMRDAVTEMGISVLAGACTTFGASLFLWGCILLFFFKFAILMTVTISLSLFYSNFFFLAIVSAIGPTGNTGSLKYFFQKLFSSCRKDE